MERILIIGLGEVGSAIYEIAREVGKHEVYGYDIDPLKSVDELKRIPRPVHYLHICIPFIDLETFVAAVSVYARDFHPKLIVVHSSVAPGTTRKLYIQLGIPVAYSPIRGKHPKLKEHILFWPKWVAALPNETLKLASKHLRELGLRVKSYKGPPESLELAKLWETVYRALMIAAWQELHRMAKAVGADTAVVMEFVGEVHEVLRDRPIYFPGFIGGHCLIHNTRILNAIFSSKLLQAVLESNNLRAMELKETEEEKTVKKLRKLAFKYVNRDYYGSMEP